MNDILSTILGILLLIGYYIIYAVMFTLPIYIGWKILSWMF